MKRGKLRISIQDYVHNRYLSLCEWTHIYREVGVLHTPRRQKEVNAVKKMQDSEDSPGLCPKESEATR